MSVSKPMYKPEMCDGQPCPGDCDLCSRWQLWDDDEEDEKEKALPQEHQLTKLILALLGAKHNGSRTYFSA